MKIPVLVVLFFGFLALTSCGGGGGSVSTPSPPPPTNAGGVWEGSTFNDQSGLTFVAFGVVTESNGEARFSNDQGQQFILSGVSGTGGNISATITAISPNGFTFIDGSLGVLSDIGGTDNAFVVQLDNGQLTITDLLLKL